MAGRRKLFNAGTMSTRLYRKARKKLAEDSLHAFMRQAWNIVEPGSEFVDGWHLHAICEHLEAVARGDLRKLIVNIPPRHCKSLLVSVFFFCWTWIRWPESRWMYSSYSAMLSTRDSVKCRTIVMSDWYQSLWGGAVDIKWDMNNKDRFENTRAGFRLATSVAGRATGEGGDFVIVDDPHKADEARGETGRNHVLDWWDNTMSTRLNDPKTGRFLIIMQRLHESDLTGHLLTGDRGYTLLCIPCEWESGHPYAKKTSLGWEDPRTQDGELIWPERFGRLEVDSLKRDLGGTYNIAGQLQQRPSPLIGGMFSKHLFKYFRDVEIDGGEGLGMVKAIELIDDEGKVRQYTHHDCWFFQTCDTALKTGEDNCYTVVMTFCVTPSGLMCVYDVARERISVPKQYGFLVEQRSRYPQVQMQAVEEAASGIGLIQEGKMRGNAFMPLKADGDKTRRAFPVSNMYMNGMVYHRAPEQAPWLEAFEHELLFFPSGTFSDQVDTLSYGGLICQFGARRRVAMGSVVFDQATEEEETKTLTDEERKSRKEGLLPAGYENWGDAPADQVVY